MEHLRAISRFWNWLPAFRAVAETAHLPSAAAAFAVSPSALSRSLKQLEGALGRELFCRSNRRLSLTPDGELLLGVVRDAMRMVHEASLALAEARMRGRLRVGSAGVCTSAWVLPAVMDLREQHPELCPEIVTDLTDLAPRLLAGRLDIAFTSRRVDHPELRTESLGTAAVGVFCGPPHPLHGRSDAARDEVLACEFVAPPPDADGAPQDGWPRDVPRRVGMYVDRMRLGAELCLRAPLLAVLPDLVAEQLGRGALRRLPFDAVPAAAVHATLRRRVGPETAAEVVLEAVRAQINPR